MLGIWGRRIAVLSVVFLHVSCSHNPEWQARQQARTTEMMDSEIVKIQGRITPAHLAQCAERQRLPDNTTSSPIDWQVSHFLTCTASTTFIGVLTPGENYIVYVGKHKASPKGLRPNEKAYMKLVCAFKVRKDTVELDNHIIPDAVERGSICTNTKDAAEYMLYQ